MSIAQPTSQPRSHNTVRGLARVFNPFVMLMAGTPLLPLYGVIEHRGRRSGKLFRTPVVVRPTDDGFIVPMPWGESTDWYRNVRAAGRCTIRWKGRDYAVTDPHVLDVGAAGASFDALQRGAMRRFGIRQALHVRRAD